MAHNILEKLHLRLLRIAQNFRHRSFKAEDLEDLKLDNLDSPLISFDAFDTLITRPLYVPSDLFLLSGHLMKSCGLISVAPEAWHSLRIKAEADARRLAGRREVTIAEIYARIAEDISDSAFNIPLTISNEIFLERELSRPIADNVEALNRLAVTNQVVIVSDTYLAQDILSSLLASCGVTVDGGPRSIIASSQEGHTKHYGTLFHHVRAWFPYATKFLHVGDNVVADVIRARQAGFTSLPYVSGAASRFERAIIESGEGTPLFRSILAGSARAARLQSLTASSSQRSIAGISSGATGVILLAFVVWLVNRAVALGIKRLYFLARDGEILLQIASRIVANSGLSLELRYLYVSRQSLHLPAISQFSKEDAAALGFQPGQTLGEFLRKLDLEGDNEISERLSLATGSDMSRDTPLSSIQLDNLIAQLDHDDVRPLILERIRKSRELLVGYLQQEKFFDSGEIGLVDVGWKGNLQRSLCKVASTVDQTIPGRLHGLYYGLYNWPTGIGTLDSYISQPEAAAVRPYVRGTLFEAMCAARHGTTRRYERSAKGEVVPVLASADNDDADRWGLAIQQRVITDFTDNVIALNGYAGLSVLDQGRELSEMASLVTRKLIGSPTLEEANALGSFPHSADQLHEGVAEIAPPFKFEPFEWRRRSRRKLPVISYWPEGSILRSLPRAIGLFLLWLLRFR